MARGFTFNGIHSKRYNILLESYSIYTPAKKKITIEVPYRSGTIDMTHLYTGGNIYEDRQITTKFSIITKKEEELRAVYNEITRWLLDTQGRQILTFDGIPGWEYKAEVVEAITYSQFFTAGTFEVKFIADPYRKGVNYEGSKLEWDNVNFLEDIIQHTKYEIETSKEISIYNGSKSITPQIVISNGKATIEKDGYKTIELGEGTHTDYNITLKTGKNDIKITGKGTVEFLFKKEAL